MMKFRVPNKLHSRTLLLVIIFFFPAIYCKGQSNSTQDSLAAKITFQHDTLDYGIIPLNSNPYRYIRFSNTGKEPLFISVFGDVVHPVKYPTVPIQPGQNAEIKISYPTGKPGPFINFIAVNSNATPHQKIIYVKGWVLHAEASPSNK